MTNTITLFNAITANQVSDAFKLSVPDSIGVADTTYSSYLEIFGVLGTGVLTLEKKCGDGVFRNLEQESFKIAANFPSDANKVLVRAINYKDRDEEFKVRLTNASGTTLSVRGINIY